MLVRGAFRDARGVGVLRPVGSHRGRTHLQAWRGLVGRGSRRNPRSRGEPSGRLRVCRSRQESHRRTSVKQMIRSSLPTSWTVPAPPQPNPDTPGVWRTVTGKNVYPSRGFLKSPQVSLEDRCALSWAASPEPVRRRRGPRASSPARRGRGGGAVTPDLLISSTSCWAILTNALWGYSARSWLRRGSASGLRPAASRHSARRNSTSSRRA
jgi:hypothetical protein